MNLAVIVVTHNSTPHLEVLFASLEGQKGCRYDLVCVDSGSGPEQVRELEAELPAGATLLRGENGGYAQAVCDGIAAAMERGHSRFLVMNADIELGPGCISLLLACRGGAGIYYPAVLYGGDRKDRNLLAAGRMGMDFSRQGITMEGNGRPFSPDGAETRSDLFPGACFLVSAETINRVGFPDTRFFMYGEEADYARRLREKDVPVFWCPRAIAWHHHDWSAGNGAGYRFQYYYQMRNRMLYFRKFGLYRQMAADLVFQAVSVPAKLLWAVRLVSPFLPVYYYTGLLHGLLGRQGRRRRPLWGLFPLKNS